MVEQLERQPQKQQVQRLGHPFRLHIRRAVSKVPTTTEEWQLPVQQYDFTQYDVGKIMAAAKPEIAARLGELIELEKYPFGKEHEVVVDVPVSPMCTPEHCALRVANL